MLHAQKPVVMGILNATPDSFYAGSRIGDALLATAAKMLEEGAGILDLGAQSTRPGAEQVGPEEELKRLMPALMVMRQAFPEAWISIDTYHSEVAKAALDAGADMINDVSAGEDSPDMLDLVAAEKVPYIAMHKKGDPKTMAGLAQYADVGMELLEYFKKKLQVFHKLGIHDWVLDPGFGFAKDQAQNYALLRDLETLHTIGRPIMVGVSRKGMVWKALNSSPEAALNGTTVLHTMALQKGASILRVHDVKEAAECVTLNELLNLRV